MDRIKRIRYLSPMRAAKVQASLRIRAISPEPPLLAHTSSESRGTFRQKARSLAPLNGWACAVKICHDGPLEDTNSLDGAQILKGMYMYELPVALHVVQPSTKQNGNAPVICKHGPYGARDSGDIEGLKPLRAMFWPEHHLLSAMELRGFWFHAQNDWSNFTFTCQDFSRAFDRPLTIDMSPLLPDP